MIVTQLVKKFLASYRTHSLITVFTIPTQLNPVHCNELRSIYPHTYHPMQKGLYWINPGQDAALEIDVLIMIHFTVAA